MFADDFLGFVTADAFSSGVPAYNASIRVEHEDRVVLNGVHRQLVSFLAHFELRFDSLSIGDVARVDDNARDFWFMQQILAYRFKDPPRSIPVPNPKLYGQIGRASCRERE